MSKNKKTRVKYLKEVKFAMKRNQSLVISLDLLPIAGLERIIIKNRDNVTEVRAEGRTRFEFGNKKTESGKCNFWLANPCSKVLLEDYLTSCFWGQFNWGELFKYQKNKKLERAIKEHIRKLVEEFESRATRELNKIVGGRFKRPSR